MRVVRAVRATVCRVGVVADLALGPAIAQRADVELDGWTAIACETRAVDPGNDHHSVRGTARAVGRGNVVGTLGSEGVDKASTDLDDVEREHPDRRMRQLGSDRGGKRAQHRNRLVERGPNLVEHATRDPGEGVERVEARVERFA